MPCSALPRGFTDTKYPWDPDIQNNPCGAPDVYANGLCKLHWQMLNGQAVGSFLPYMAAVLADSPRGYWRLDEASGTFADSSGLAHTLTPQGGVTYSAAGATRAGTGITLNGTTGAATTPDHNDFDLGDVFTLEAWVKLAGWGPAPYNLIHKGGGGYQLYIETLGALYIAKAGITSMVSSVVPVPTDSQWHHCVGTKNGAVNKVYIDGVDRSSAVTNATIVDTVNPLWIGAGAGGVQFLNGSIDEVAVYATELSAARVLAHFQAALA